MTEPTSAEVMRRLDEVLARVEKLTTTLEQSYVRKDVYDSDRRGDLATLRGEIKDVADDVRDLKSKADKQETQRRQIIAGVAVAFLAQVFQLFITFNVIRGG